jgi:hypothetical protein
MNLQSLGALKALGDSLARQILGSWASPLEPLWTCLLRTVGSMNVGVTRHAKSDQIFQGVISKRAAKTDMMNLQLASATTVLAPPAIAIQDLATKL